MNDTPATLKGEVFGWQRHFPFVHSLFMKIAEPRAIRIMQFLIYLLLLYTGVGVILDPPGNFQHIVGDFWVFILGSFVALGATMGASAVLPGVWWLERVGLILLGAGISMYMVIAISLGQSSLGIALFFVILITFIQRWSEIKGAQLAPIEPREK